jgi:2-dehydro-3-deoxyphosphogluconate aldolase/(4S)-4-hydroxy-2-oxoglutarate aldolase
MKVGVKAASDMARPAIPEPVRSTGILAIGRRLDPGRVVPIAEALVRGGVRAFEVTLDSEAALEAIGALANRWGIDGDLLVGAGTVLDRAAAERATGAGARFLVMPHTDEDLVRWLAERGVPTFPGAFTPTEILAAWEAGAAAVKLFPASVVGPTFVREMQGPLPWIPLVPTGGVTLESAVAFVKAGAAAVGLGGWLIGEGLPAEVERRAQEVVTAIRELRSETPG